VTSKETVTSSKTLRVVGVLFAPLNLIVGFVERPTLGVTSIFLSELAIIYSPYIISHICP
jgi:hypothetical protein